MTISRLAFALVAVAAIANADDKTPSKSQPPSKPDVKSDTSASGAISISPKELKWGIGPPDLPKNAQIAVLFGDPGKPGRFTVRLKVPDGYKVPPHWHSQEEELTILQGKLMLHMGDTMTSPAHELEAGGYHHLPAKMHHGAEVRGETIIQLSGPGPFDIHYVNAADNPNPQNARR